MYKKVGILFIFCLLLGNLLPSFALAATSSSFDADLQKYLKNVTEVRGFEVTESKLKESLAQWGLTLEDYETVAELKEDLGEVIKANGSNLQTIYDEYNEMNPVYALDKTKLEAILQKNGEELNDYVFMDDLREAIHYYIGTPQEVDFNKKLEVLLKNYSKTRGFTVTNKHIESSLDMYGYQLGDFGTVAELEEFLGEVIKVNESNLSYFQDIYGLDQETIVQALKDNGKTLDDYVFLDNLEYDLLEMGVISEDDWLNGDLDFEELLQMLNDDYDLNEDELNHLVAHFESISDKFSDSGTLDRLESLAMRMQAFIEFDTVTELTAEQIAELVSIYDEFLNIFELKVEFIFINQDGSKSLSLADAMALTDIKNAKLKINLYNLNGDFLADLIITGEQVNSNIINNAGGQISNTINNAEQKTATNTGSQSTNKVINKQISRQVNKAEKAGTSSTQVKTVDGAKLPKTASNFLANSTIGAAMLLIGVGMYRKVRKTL